MTNLVAYSRVATVPFESPITMSIGKRRMDWDGGVAAAILSLAASGHVDGAELTIEFPANTVTELYLAPELNIRGALLVDPDTNQVTTGFDETKKHQIELACIGTVIVGAYFELAESDVTVPSLVSATIDTVGNPNALVATYSELCVAPDITGLSLPFTVGTARTITAVESGSGTANHTYTLSGNVAFGDVCKLIIGSTRTLCDYSGNLVATNGSGTSVSVTGANTLVAKAAWTRCFESNVQMAPASGNFSSWTDQVGNSATFAPAGVGNAQRTVAPNASIQFTTATDQRIKTTASLGAGDWAVFVRVLLSDSSGWTFANFNTNGTDNIRMKLASDAAGFHFSTYDGATSVTLDNSPFFTATSTWYNVAVARVSGTVTLTVQGQAPVTVSDTAVLTSITHLTLGAETIQAGGVFEQGNGQISDVAWKTGSGFVGSELTDVFAYVNAR